MADSLSHVWYTVIGHLFTDDQWELALMIKIQFSVCYYQTQHSCMTQEGSQVHNMFTDMLAKTSWVQQSLYIIALTNSQVLNYLLVIYYYFCQNIKNAENNFSKVAIQKSHSHIHTYILSDIDHKKDIFGL